MGYNAIVQAVRKASVVAQQACSSWARVEERPDPVHRGWKFYVILRSGAPPRLLGEWAEGSGVDLDQHLLSLLVASHEQNERTDPAHQHGCTERMRAGYGLAKTAKVAAKGVAHLEEGRVGLTTVASTTRSAGTAALDIAEQARRNRAALSAAAPSGGAGTSTFHEFFATYQKLYRSAAPIEAEALAKVQHLFEQATPGLERLNQISATLNKLSAANPYGDAMYELPAGMADEYARLQAELGPMFARAKALLQEGVRHTGKLRRLGPVAVRLGGVKDHALWLQASMPLKHQRVLEKTIAKMCQILNAPWMVWLGRFTAVGGGVLEAAMQVAAPGVAWEEGIARGLIKGTAYTLLGLFAGPYVAIALVVESITGVKLVGGSIDLLTDAIVSIFQTEEGRERFWAEIGSGKYGPALGFLISWAGVGVTGASTVIRVVSGWFASVREAGRAYAEALRKAAEDRKRELKECQLLLKKLDLFDGQCTGELTQATRRGVAMALGMLGGPVDALPTVWLLNALRQKCQDEGVLTELVAVPL